MTIINYSTKCIGCKIVYFGTSLGGKTTNIEYLHNCMNPETRGRLVSLKTQTERTLFFDFLPMDIGKIRGFDVKLNVYTIPGQVHYQASRRIILKDVDGVIFIADSQNERMEANIESRIELDHMLIEHGYDPLEVPLIIQYNKRDLDFITPVEVMRQHLNTRQCFDFEAAAPTGYGVIKTFETMVKLLLKQLKVRNKQNNIPTPSPYIGKVSHVTSGRYH